MAQKVRPDDPRLTWQGTISFNDTKNWRMPWRIPYKQLALFPPDALRERAAMPAGVRISCYSDTEFIEGLVEPSEEASSIDLYCDGEFSGSVEYAGQNSFRFDSLPAGEKLLELWLPQHAEFRLRGIEFSDGATISPFEDSRPKWVTYGSSITHCRTAESPSLTWPAIASRNHEHEPNLLGLRRQLPLRADDRPHDTRNAGRLPVNESRD